MPAKLRLSLSADAAAKLSIAVYRTDVSAGEPGDLQKFVDLEPGEALVLDLHERSVITIAEQTALATAAD